jgi:hypothetical protein
MSRIVSARRASGFDLKVDMEKGLEVALQWHKQFSGWGL